MSRYIVLIGCVFGIAVGQILFKVTASSLGAARHPAEILIKPELIAALVIYACSTVVWVWQLQKIELNRAYPLMALSFVIVPLFSHLVLGEPSTWRYWVGVALVVAGVLFTQL